MKKKQFQIFAFVLVSLLSFGSFLAFAQMIPQEQENTEAEAPAAPARDNDILFVSAALAVGLSSVAAGWAVSTVGSAALGAISEKPELVGRALIFVGLAEGIAIYGLIISIMILGKA